MTDPIGAASSALLPTPEAARPKNAAEAAEQFEAMLLNQMLRSAHESEDQEDSTQSTMWEMAAQQLSQVLAESGGLGIAKLLTEGLGEGEKASPPQQ